MSGFERLEGHSVGCPAGTRARLVTQLGLIFAFLSVIGAAVWVLMSRRPLMGDERVHVGEIAALTRWFYTGATFTPLHPAIPGYHLTVAVLAAMASTSSLAGYRAVSVAINLLLAPAALAVAWALSGGDLRLSVLRMTQVFFMAIAFPFLGLLYTDLFSAALVLFTFALLFRERYLLAAILGMASMAVRQNNVLWFGLAFVLTWVQIVRNVVEDASTDVPQEVHALGSIAAQKSLRREFVIHAAGPFSSFLLGFLAFGTFLAWNGGQIALADQDAHPPFTFHAGNVWAVAFTECFLFLPLAVALFGRIVHWSRENSGRVLLGGCVLSSLYLITFRNTHPYNFLPWWLHNKVVLLATSSLGWELVFLVPVLCQSLVFVCTPFWRTELYLLYPVAIVYLAASWLIEPRYFFIPLMLFALFRKPGHQSVEWALAAWNVLGGIALFWGVCHGLWLP